MKAILRYAQGLMKPSLVFILEVKGKEGMPSNLSNSDENVVEVPNLNGYG